MIGHSLGRMESRIKKFTPHCICRYFIFFTMSMYPVIFPGLYMHMFAQRKKQFGKPKKAKAPKKDGKGVQFPHDTDTTRSTSVAGAKIFQAALSASKLDDSAKLAEACGNAGKKWRFGYVKHFKNSIRASCHSKEECLAIAEAGLDYMYQNFEFIRADDSTVSFAEEMKRTLQ